MHSKQKLITAFFKTPTGTTPEVKEAGKIQKSVKRKFMTTFNKTSQPDRATQWNGYLFVATNNFREYSVVNTLPRVNYESKELVPAGYVVATATIDDDSALEHIDVKEPFQRQKIGSELMRFIKLACPQLTVFGGTERNCRYRLTEEGAKLVNYCLKNKILSMAQVITSTVPASPEHSYDGP